MNKTENLGRFMQFAGTGEIDTDSYYRDVYEKISSGQRIVWNWSAFLFGGNWIIYRKMYLYAHLFYISIMSINVTLGFVLNNVLGNHFITNNRFILFIIGTMWPNTLCGLFGNSIYFLKITGKMSKYNLSEISVKPTDNLTALISISSLLWSYCSTAFGISFMLGMIIYYSAIYISILCHFLKDEISLRSKKAASYAQTVEHHANWPTHG